MKEDQIKELLALVKTMAAFEDAKQNKMTMGNDEITIEMMDVAPNGKTHVCQLTIQSKKNKRPLAMFNFEYTLRDDEIAQTKEKAPEKPEDEDDDDDDDEKPAEDLPAQREMTEKEREVIRRAELDERWPECKGCGSHYKDKCSEGMRRGNNRKRN